MQGSIGIMKKNCTKLHILVLGGEKKTHLLDYIPEHFSATVSFLSDIIRYIFFISLLKITICIKLL